MITKRTRAVLISLCALTCVALTGCGGEKNDNIKAGMTLIDEHNYEQAVTSFNEAITAGENAEEAYRGMGIAYMGMTCYEDAVNAFKSALDNGGNVPDDIDYDINYYLGVCYFKLEMYEDAVARYDAIIALRPKEKDAYIQRGTTRLAMNMYPQAKEDFDKAISLEPKNYSLYIDVFCLLNERGYAEQGAEYLQVAIDKNDKNMSDVDKGRMYYYLGEYQTARGYLEQARSDGERSEEVLLYLGQCYVELDQTAYAIGLFEAFLANNPSASVYNQLGLAYLKQHEYENALNAFESGIATGSDSYRQELLFNRVVACEEMGDFESAKSYMKDYLNEYPDDRTALREYEFLKTR